MRMDSSTILMAAVSLVGTCMGSLSGLKLASYRIEQLEMKVDKHNNFAERIPVIEEQIKVINHRVLDLEETQNEHRNN